MDLPGRGALLPPGFDNKGHALRSSRSPVTVTLGARSIINGDIKGEVSAAGLVTISRSDGTVVLTETYRDTTQYTSTAYQMLSPYSGSYKPDKYTAEPGTSYNADPGTYNAVYVPSAGCGGGTPKGACCLDVDNWDTADGAAVGVSSCNAPNRFPKGVGNQRWNYNAATKSIAVHLDGRFCLHGCPVARAVQVVAHVCASWFLLLPVAKAHRHRCRNLLPLPLRACACLHVDRNVPNLCHACRKVPHSHNGFGPPASGRGGHCGCGNDVHIRRRTAVDNVRDVWPVGPN